jgi:transposase-like protein
MKKSNYEPYVTKRYSKAFRQKVVNEIESGKLSLRQAQKIYDIGGTGTINRWIKNLGKSYLLSNVVKIEMKDEKDKVKELQDRVRKLEKLLADKELDNLMNEAFLELMAEDTGINLEEFKKKVDKERLIKRR